MNFTTVKEWEHAGLVYEVVEVNFAPTMEISHNGYVTVPKTNKEFGKDYYDVEQDVVELTYGEGGKFGFDTNHYGDTAETESLKGVVAVTEKLAEALAKENT